MANFRHFTRDFAQICTGSADNINQFIYDSSINQCRELIREHASTMTRQLTLERIAPDYVSPVLNTMLLEETSLSLMKAPRLEPKNRMSNTTFCTMMKRKLRLQTTNQP
eukprot:scaffold58635_cov59-Cyclotella_meneghiniana.AAC.2